MTPRTSLLLALLATLSCRELVSDTEIGRGAATGDLHALRSLLRGGTDPDLSDGHGYAPLHGAARNGHLTVIRALLKAGAHVDLRDGRNGWTPLLHAVHKREGQAVLELLESGADPNGRATGGVTPLMMAAGYGMTDTVKALLERGADPHAEARGGITALWGALGVGGIADITDGPGLGACFPETVRALLARAPHLKLKDNVATRAARFLARSEQCREAYALVEPRRRS